MALFEEDREKKPVRHEIGEDLDRVSVAELQERIALLDSEIARIRAAIAAKGSTKQAAEALFRNA